MSEIRSFVAEKEQEWKSALNQQLALLEESLASREAELREERGMSAQLKEDFKYNMRLLQERDEELANLEKENLLLKQQCVALEEKVSSVSVKHDEAKQKLEEERYVKSKLAEQQQELADSKERELQYLRHEHELEACRLKDEHSALRRQQEMEIGKYRKELELQKRELLGSFDRRAEELRSEYQQRVQLAERSALDWEMKCDLLEKDNAGLERSRADLLQRLRTGEQRIAELERQLAEALARMQADASVSENEKERLQELLASLEAQHSAAVERLEAKAAGLQSALDAKEQEAEAGKRRLKEERAGVRRQTADLVAKLHEAEASFLRRTAELEQQLRAKDKDNEALGAQLEELQAKLEASGSEVSRLFVDKDAELQRLRSQLLASQEEAQHRRADAERYRRELQLAMEKDKELEARRQQLEVDHQRRMEELEVLQYEKSETYIQKLTEARDSAEAELRQVREALAQKQTVVQSLLKDRELALLTLKQHGLSIDRSLESKVAEAQQQRSSEARVRELEAQNETLKEIVKRMRGEMEALQQPQQQQQQQPPAVAIESLGGRELANAFAKLRTERTDLLAQCRKQQARVQRLEAALAECEGEKADALTAGEQLRYELSAQRRHHDSELAAVKRSVRDLEARLDESQKEADEYYKANIEQAGICEQLQRRQLEQQQQQQQQQQRPGEVNFGAQELYIQQLQDEIAGLRARLQARRLFDCDGGDADDGGGAGGDGERVSSLRAKLKLAAGHIRKLAEENQTLVDVSNRLRAELRAAGSGPGGPSGKRRQQQQQQQQQQQRQLADEASAARRPLELQRPSRRVVRDALGDIGARLQELERLQYHVTREELAHQQQHQHQQQQQRRQPAADSYDDESPVKDVGTAEAVVGQKSSRPTAAAVGQLPRAEGLGRSVQSLGLSSLGAESLQEVWQLLDEPPTAGRGQQQLDGERLVVRGKQAQTAAAR